jgi:hypothetical protein
MKKITAFPVLVLLALPIAGAFGVIHDQVSFTVSHEYFTKFKFLQFGFLDPAIPERLRAAAVGFLASWWMGIPIGLLVAPIALIHRSGSIALRVGLRSYLVLVAFAAIFALAGLTYGFFQTRAIDLRDYQDWFVPPDVVHLRRYLCTGYMHNSAYLGGIGGIVIAWLFHIVIRLRKEPAQAPAPTRFARGLS